MLALVRHCMEITQPDLNPAVNKVRTEELVCYLEITYSGAVVLASKRL